MMQPVGSESDGGYPDLLNAAADREQALREEVERLREDNQYLNDLYEANEFGIVQQAWADEVERLRGKCNRLRDAYLKATDTTEVALEVNTRLGSWNTFDQSNGLHPGDLDPEPQEPE